MQNCSEEVTCTHDPLGKTLPGNRVNDVPCSAQRVQLFSFRKEKLEPLAATVVCSRSRSRTKTDHRVRGTPPKIDSRSRPSPQPTLTNSAPPWSNLTVAEWDYSGGVEGEGQ
ncbi:hypothetical protein B0H17DRAFT_240608 [Mycena rosella]|uniref:Uncharacterized protein n=1 Tax=Mycena rosella TaxID=1033263 RepID=A0AAD7H1N6_MYCRO|nr:hypothetical protein B0H17DRAFT_240608 [Mycena rosella]